MKKISIIAAVLFLDTALFFIFIHFHKKTLVLMAAAIASLSIGGMSQVFTQTTTNTATPASTIINYNVLHYIEGTGSNAVEYGERYFMVNSTVPYTVAENNFVSLFPDSLVTALTQRGVDLNNIKTWNYFDFIAFYTTLNTEIQKRSMSNFLNRNTWKV